MSDVPMKILFVDDEQRILDGLRRQFHPRKSEWHMRFAPSGEAALAMLAESPADIVISDMRMDGMSGATLLGCVREMYPLTTRVILSGQTNPAELLEGLGCVHQYLQKPCDPAALANVIQRTAKLRRMVPQAALRTMVGKVTALPPRYETWEAIVTALSNPAATVQSVAEVVESDPALTAKVMQLVSTEFFGVPRATHSAREAIDLLGLTTLRAVVFTGRIFDVTYEVDRSRTLPTLTEVAHLWEASVSIADAAQGISRRLGACLEDQRLVRVTGMLSLIGRTMLLCSGFDAYQAVVAKAREGGSSLSECEAERYGVSQDSIAAYALGLWGLPEVMVQAVANQANALTDPSACVFTTSLHLARALQTTESWAIDVGPRLDPGLLADPRLADLANAGQRKAA